MYPYIGQANNGASAGINYASYPPAGAQDGKDSGEPLENYLKNRPELSQSVNNLAQATLALFDMENHFTGNCVAIGTNLVLTSKHTVNGGYALVGNLLGEVVFDGSRSGKLDFKILRVAEANLKPVILDVVPSIGESIQMYFKIEGSGPHRYVKQFESADGPYATRSDIGSVPTNPGESGAPRMSLFTGFVHSIHQGEREGLKINDVYSVLEQASRNDIDPQHVTAIEILERINVANLEMSLMSSSTVVLQEGSVAEEKARIARSVKVTVFKNKEKVEATFDYTEIGKPGPRPRWITINRAGVKNSQVKYAIEPNPHDNDAYNKGGQVKFYESIAKAIGRELLEKDAYPNQGTLELLDEVYTLTRI